MKSFNDTKDDIEILFKNRILQRFPNYAIFWENFIGYKDDTSTGFKPYGLIFPKKYLNNKKGKITKKYEKINVIHHHIFCSLSGAHFELENYLSNLTIGGRGTFIRHNAVNSFYIHIGICRDMIGILVKYILLDLAEEKIRELKKCDKCNSIIENGHLNAFYDYLKNDNEELADCFSEWKSRVSKIRARLSHCGSIGKLMDNTGEEYILKKFSTNATWFDDHDEMRKGNKKRIIDSLEDDLKETEELLNQLYNLFISKFQEFLDKENIKMDY